MSHTQLALQLLAYLLYDDGKPDKTIGEVSKTMFNIFDVETVENALKECGFAKTAKPNKEEIDQSEIISAILQERHYQKQQLNDPSRKDIIDLRMGEILSAITYNLHKAIEQWYKDSEPYTETSHYLRKIAALCIQSGEKYGMPNR